MRRSPIEIALFAALLARGGGAPFLMALHSVALRWKAPSGSHAFHLQAWRMDGNVPDRSSGGGVKTS